MRHSSTSQSGSTLIVTITVVATLLVLLGVAVDYTTQISRGAERSRKTAVAMEIADGHLEALFTSWRNIYRTTWESTTGYPTGGTDYSRVGGNYFYTAMYSPAPAPTAIPQMSPAPGATPPKIPLPDRFLFPSEPNYTVTEYRIQGVDPMISLDAAGNALVEGDASRKGTGGFVPLNQGEVPPAAYGPNKAVGFSYLPGGFPYSFYYLASVNVTVPTLKGNVTTKMRRVFEKKFDLPWSYGMFYVDDLELHPSTPLTLTGPIHTNGSLYISTSNFTAASPTYALPTPFPTSGRVEYGTDYVNGYSPRDPRYPGSGFTAPNFAKSDAALPLSDCPPSQVSPYLPFGWNLALNSSGGNNSSYHEIIERPVGTGTDPLFSVRYYSQPGYRIVIHPDTYNGDGSVNTVGNIDITYIDRFGAVSAVSGSTKNKFTGNNGSGSSTTILDRNHALFDKRENAAIKVTNFNIKELINNLSSLSGWTGLVYIADAGATTYNPDGTLKSAGTSAPITIGGVTTWTTRRAIRLVNGYKLPSSTNPLYDGLTIVSENPVYIQGNYNTSANLGDAVPSNTGTYSDSDASGYTREPAAVVADAITVLSAGWNDATSHASVASRIATANTTINAALVSGNVPSNGANYSGGGENFIRLLEDWSTRTFCYYGSMVQLYASSQAKGVWNGDGTVYVAPQTTRWFHDHATFSDASPPGSLQIAAYLQQQRWYQVF